MRKCSWGWLAVVVMVAGCGKSPVKVQGMVKLDGKPLAGASVQFIAQEAGNRDAFGTTDAEGVFHLSTTEPGDGALPGKYKVVIQATVETEGAAAATPTAGQGGGNKPKGTSVTLPARYTQPDKTVLTQDVPPKGEVVFELQSK